MLSGLAAPSSRLEVGGDVIEAGAYCRRLSPPYSPDVIKRSDRSSFLFWLSKHKEPAAVKRWKGAPAERASGLRR
jgi:hypothetical protein